MNANTINGNLIVNNGFKEHDNIQGKIYALNHRLGLKTIMGGAWTYDKLARNAAVKLSISFFDNLTHLLGKK